jgi:RecJ-like exonuclease
MWEETICPICHGAGKAPDGFICFKCNGKGLIYTNENGDCISSEEKDFLDYLDYLDNERKAILEDTI